MRTSKLKTLPILLLSVGFYSLPPALLAQEAVSAAAPSDKVQEVVVTASRRAERLQDVPLSVTAVTPEALENAGVRDVTELGTVISGITYGSSPADAGFRIRGAGQMGGFSSASETPVGVVVDGVVYGLGQAFDNLGGIERVEVLKGPQGTQFGKNASSGVVSITTPNPTMDRLKGRAFVSAGNGGERELRGALNAPLGETVAARIAVYHRKNDGYVHNVIRNEEWGGVERKGIRAKLLFKPSASFDALLTLDASQSDQKGPNQMWTLRRAAPALLSGYPYSGGAFGNVIPAGVVVGPENRTAIDDVDAFYDTRRSGASLEMNYVLGGYVLTSVSAYRTDKLEQEYGVDATGFDIMHSRASTDKTQSTQEFRVTSPKGERVEYVAGYFYYKQPTDNVASTYLRPGMPASPTHVSLTNGIGNNHTESVSHALYADGKLRLSADGRTRLLFGARVNRDTVDAQNWSVLDPSLGTPAAPYRPLALTSGRTAETGTSGRLGLEHRVHKDLLLYGTVATGFLGPTVTFTNSTNVRTNVKPQEVRDVTLGFKSQFLNRRITLNGSVFSDRYTDLQTAVSNGTEFVTENAGGARTRGVELDLSARLTPELRLRASATWADAVFTSYTTACNAAADAAVCSGPVVNGRPLFYDAAGDRIPGSPKLTSVLGLDYASLLGEDYVFDASANYSYRSRTGYVVGVPSLAQDGYGVLNLSGHFGAADDKWRIGVYVRNALDKHYQAAVIAQAFNRPGGVVNWNTFESARHAGVTLELRY